MVPSALSPSLSHVPSTSTPCPKNTWSWARAGHPGSACLVRTAHNNSLLCPLLLVQKTWKCSPKAGLKIAAPFLLLVKSTGSPLVGLFTLHHVVVCEHKNGSCYRGDKLKCGRQKGLIGSSRLVQRGGRKALGHHHAMTGGDHLQICRFSVTSSALQDTGIDGTLLMAHDTVWPCCPLSTATDPQN